MIERYSRPEMSRLWSDEHRLKTMLRVESSFLEILAKDKGISEAELKVVHRLFHKSLLASAKGSEEKSGHGAGTEWVYDVELVMDAAKAHLC